MTVATFIMLMTILSDMGTAGVAFIEIRKDIEARTAAGTLGLKDPLPPEHVNVVKHRLEAGLWASDDVWKSTHAGN